MSHQNMSTIECLIVALRASREYSTLQLLSKRLEIMFISLAVLLFFGCDQKSLQAEGMRFDQLSSQIDFSREIAGEWDRLCVFGPYSSSEFASSVLEFDWDLEANSGVYLLDSISLIVAVHESEVVALYEIDREHADFSGLSGKCYLRENTKFMRNGSRVTFVGKDM